MEEEVKNEYVNYKLGLLLNEKGFDEPCEYYIVPEGLSGKMIGCDNVKEPHKKLRNSELNLFNDAVSCPTIQMVMSWLRSKGILIYIEIIEEEYDYFDGPNHKYDHRFLYVGKIKMKRCDITLPPHISYNVAITNAISYILNKIKNNL
jgi:hypothetical protein